MGDMADYDLDQILFPDGEPDWGEEEEIEKEKHKTEPKPESCSQIEPTHKPASSKPMDIRSLINNTEAVIGQLADLKDGEMDEDGDFEDVMHFLLPSLLENQPNDLVRILWDRAVKRSEESSVKNPAREFQMLLQDFDLTLAKRM